MSRWTAQTVPPELLEIVSAAAGKAHKPGGEVAGNLADVLNAYDALRAAGLVSEPFCPCCSQGNHDMMCDGTCGVEGCCHPLYHVDRDMADEQRTAELHERMRIMDAQDARVDWDWDPEDYSEPSEPLPVLDPRFIVHAFALDARNLTRCGAEGGRTTVRRDAIECLECFELTRPVA